MNMNSMVSKSPIPQQPSLLASNLVIPSSYDSCKENIKDSANDGDFSMNIELKSQEKRQEALRKELFKSLRSNKAITFSFNDGSKEEYYNDIDSNDGNYVYDNQSNISEYSGEILTDKTDPLRHSQIEQSLDKAVKDNMAKVTIDKQEQLFATRTSIIKDNRIQGRREDKGRASFLSRHKMKSGKNLTNQTLEYNNKLRILVSSANIGNEIPSVESIASWLPKNGRIHDIVVDDSSSKQDQNKNLYAGEIFDIIVIGMQESNFKVSSKTSNVTKKGGNGNTRDVKKDKNELFTKQDGLMFDEEDPHLLHALNHDDCDEIVTFPTFSKLCDASPHLSTSSCGEDELSIGTSEEDTESSFRAKYNRNNSSRISIYSLNSDGSSRSLIEGTKRNEMPCLTNFSHSASEGNTRKSIEEKYGISVLIDRKAETKFDRHGNSAKKDSDNNPCNFFDMEEEYLKTAIRSVSGDIKSDSKRSSGEILVALTSRARKSIFKPVKKVKGGIRSITASEDHTKHKETHSKLMKRWSTIRSSSKKNHLNPAEVAGGDTAVLHRLISSRCNGKNDSIYDFPVQYQRGEMRLTILVKKKLMKEVQDIDYKGYNTGIGNIFANKGGIVATLTIRNTRLSFVAVHLEAHEGHEHYAARCSNLSSILGGARVGSKISRLYDASVSSHHCFVCGDLNYRLDVPSPSKSPKIKDSRTTRKSLSNAESKAAHEIRFKDTMRLVRKKKWDTLKEYDELTKALSSGDCLAGFKTPACNFPPTFKVKKGVSGYIYDTHRIPSYTDRILWKSFSGLENNVECISYSPCQLFSTSDHKPIRGAFLITTNTNEPGQAKLITPSLSNTDFLTRKKELPESKCMPFFSNSHTGTRVNDLSIFIYGLKCHNLVPVGGKFSINPYVKIIIDPVDLLVKRVRRRQSTLRKIGSSVESMLSRRNINMHGTRSKNNIKIKKKSQNDAKTNGINDDNIKFMRTRTIQRDQNPNWDGGTIHFKFPGLDDYSQLFGAVMYITVMNMNKKTDDELIGTVAINLHRLFSHKSGIFKFDKMDNGLIEDMTINENVLRDGKIQGELECSISSLFGLPTSTYASNNSTSFDSPEKGG